LNPSFPLPVLIPLAAIALAIAALGAWRGSSGISGRMRTLLLALRLLAVLAVLAILFNPGKWTRPSETRISPWIILNDVSSSMAQPTSDGGTRAASATTLIQQTTAHAKSADIPIRIHPFSSKLDAASSDQPPPTGSASNILPAVSQVLQANHSPASSSSAMAAKLSTLPKPISTRSACAPAAATSPFTPSPSGWTHLRPISHSSNPAHP
jgi:hypothetical protein